MVLCSGVVSHKSLFFNDDETKLQNQHLIAKYDPALTMHSPESRIDGPAIDLDVYTRLCKAINETLGESIIPDPRCTSLAKVPFFEQRRAAYTVEHHECRSRIVDGMASFTIIHSWPPRFSTENRAGTTQYIIPTLVKEAYIPDNTSIFTNRRLTALPDGRLALVPASTKAGDHIVSLAGSKVPCVLRRHSGAAASQIPDVKIHGAFPRLGDFKSYAPHGCMTCNVNLVSCPPNLFSMMVF